MRRYQNARPARLPPRRRGEPRSHRRHQGARRPRRRRRKRHRAPRHGARSRRGGRPAGDGPSRFPAAEPPRRARRGIEGQGAHAFMPSRARRQVAFRRGSEMRREAIEDTMLDGRVKGIPGTVAGFPLGSIGGKGWNILREDLPLPVAVLRRSALTRNGAWMREYLALSGAVIAPHGKTTMSPQLFEQQIDDGAWAMTVATTQQLRICRDSGIARIVLANQLIGRQAIGYLLDEIKRDPGFDFYCLVDSVANVEQLAAAARQAAPGRPLQVLLEGGMAGGRTGCRDLAAALAVARAVKAAGAHLVLRGVEGFEGLIHSDSPKDDAAEVASFLDFLGAIAVACEAEGLFAAETLILS